MMRAVLFILLFSIISSCGGDRHIDRPAEPEIHGDFSGTPTLLGKQLRKTSFKKRNNLFIIHYETSEHFRNGGFRIIENHIGLDLKKQKAINPIDGDEIGELICVQGPDGSDEDLSKCSKIVTEIKNKEFLRHKCEKKYKCPDAPETLQFVLTKMRSYDVFFSFKEDEKEKLSSIQNYLVSIQKDKLRWIFITRLKEMTNGFLMEKPIGQEVNELFPILSKGRIGIEVSLLLDLPRKIGDLYNVYYSKFKLVDLKSKAIKLGFDYKSSTSNEVKSGLFEVIETSTEEEILNSTISPKRDQKVGRDPSSERKTKLFGHNLSPTTYTLNKGDASVGTYAAIVGVTDDLIVGTSPWMYLDYNMYTGVIRYGKQYNDRIRLGGQLIYFKTDRQSLDIAEGYQMEAYSGNLTMSYKLPSKSVLHFNYNHMYFLDETVPFSLRREPFNDDPYQSSLTVMVETKMSDRWGILGEVGVLGMNYTYPQVILGTSTHYEFDSFLIQLGFNITSTPISLFSSDRDDANNSNFGQLTTDPDQGKYDFSIHPEIQLQYSF